MSEYAGSVDGVRALLPHRVIDVTSKPTQAQVDTFVGAIRALVASRLGPADLLSDLYFDGTPGRRDRLLAAADHVIELGAAAMTEDAMSPERADPTSGSRYGAVLWERHRQALTDLLADAGESSGADGAGASAGGPSSRAAAAFPPPAGFASAAW